ncbi:GDSL esterase/lipase At1g71691-like [Rhododendron vialii]|uniref:GDSL esterase/lipase At1g71691-like n=1 Tax=Rhododendron vialii TaxID=182163 RepID=UPI00265FA193|nr:GDSL esterase/lipase At1g71691-like [Rhododendron vialii]
MGCTPLYANQSDPLAICCNESINQLLMPFNNSLPTTLMKLQSDLPGSVFSNSDDFRFVSDLKSNVAKYGISNTTGSCLSEYFGGTPCADRDRYLYFDMVHTTQAANYVFSLNCFNGTLCSPGNIISLVGAQVY